MPYECYYTGKKTRFGKMRAWHGQAITKGGFGLKPTGISPRTFKPNLQEVVAIVDGGQKRIKVSTRAIRSGLVTKALKRKYGYTRKAKGGN